MKITDLNVDCLLRIFSYCSDQDLLNIGRSNWFLSDVIDENIFHLKSLDLLMCGHRNGPSIEQRTQTKLTYSNRLSIASNWVDARYHERKYFHHAQMFPTKLLLERDYLYITSAAYLRQYRRIHQEPLQRRFQLEIATASKTDISDFVKKRDTLFAGRVCGMCYIYEGDCATEQRLHSSKEYLHCVDFVGDLYVSSSNKCCKFFRRADEFGLIHLDMTKQLNQEYKALQLSADGQTLYGGLYTDHCRRALRSVDMETGKEIVLNSNTISIYDLKLKDDHVIFTANFDTTFRMYDRRTDEDVAIWEDPFDSSFYCLDYDGLYAVLCGAKYHSRVNLYDIRMPGKYVQLYFPHRNREHYNSSPVYSIACDSRFLFIATDHNLRVFDFKTDSAVSRDYRNLFSEKHRI